MMCICRSDVEKSFFAKRTALRKWQGLDLKAPGRPEAKLRSNCHVRGSPKLSKPLSSWAPSDAGATVSSLPFLIFRTYSPLVQLKPVYRRLGKGTDTDTLNTYKRFQSNGTALLTQIWATDRAQQAHNTYCS